MFFNDSPQKKHKREAMKKVIAESKEKGLSLEDTKKALAVIGIDYFSVMNLSGNGRSLIEFLEISPEEFNKLGFDLWIS